MESMMSALRAIHVLAGVVALFVAPGALLTVKGGRAHRRWGKIYFWAMTVVAATAVVLGVWRPNVFLALLAVFSFYLAFSAYRVLGRKRPDRGDGPTGLDWTAALLTGAASAALIGLSVTRPSAVWQQLGLVPVVFGAIGLILAGRDIWSFVRPPADRNAWWFAHMTGMLASYIAAVSAFSVVNFTFLPTTVRWLWPTVIGTPAITIWITYYKLHFARARPAGDKVTV